ncbi:unnamed protein product, partial [Ectocarpus sp. 8 AP-2014]
MDAVENGEASAAAAPPPTSTATEVVKGNEGDGGEAVANSGGVSVEKDVSKDGGGTDESTASGSEEGGGKKKKKKKDDEEKAKSVGTAKLLLKYASPLEMLYMFLGTISAIVCGLTVPNFILVFGDVMDKLNGDNILDTVLFWNTAGEQVALKLKKEYVRAILRQDIGWFDEHPAGELPSAVTSAMAKIQDGIGRKV